MHRILFCIVILAVLLPGSTSHAYRLPPYAIAEADRTPSAEEVLARYRSRIDEIGSRADLARLEEHRVNRKIRLSRAERESALLHESLKVPVGFWKRVVALKGSLAGLHGAAPPAEALAEADTIARIIIERLYALSQRFDIAGSALIQNFLINRGIKKEGFCYHYVEDLFRALSAHRWSQFDLHWGAAWAGDFRENNALVITARGTAFESGIAIDAWRTAGRPFWTPVQGDRFPWKEDLDVVVEK